MKCLVIATGYNRSGINPKTGKPWQDATGAFLPEAAAFIKIHGGSRLELVSPQTPAKRRLLVESAIRGEPGLDVLSIFGHGVSNGLLATGHMMAQSFELALAIRDVRAKTVIFYACSTAAGRRGFADYVADSLPGVNLWAHTSAGHASWNPNTQLAGGPNGGDMVVRKSEPLWKRWVARMHDDRTFRLSFWQVAHGLKRADALEAVRGAV
jgi:hypothetical protein